MLKVGLYDTNFGHSSSSSGRNIPRYFRWCRKPHEGTCFFTDCYLNVASTIHASKKIAWLLEPPAICQDIYRYIQENSDQFDYVLTYNRELVDYKKILFYPFGGCWVANTGIRLKRQLVSIIASNKTRTQGHQLRHEVIRRYHPHISSFGQQYRPIGRKEDALADFMFSIVIENSKLDDYFTEKLIDCFAVGTVPIYWGTNNICQYFDMRGILAFNSLDELDLIMTKLSPRLYNSLMHHIRNNFRRHFRYRVAEDWIFEQYRYLFI